jgi:NAD(P)H-dependent nitrite reductase small subunit
VNKASGAARRFICELGDVLDGAGVCALIDGEQVAVFRVGEEVFALENCDPFSQANVLSRGLLGDLQGQLVVASPIYKQHFNLRTGRCLEDESVTLRVWPCGVLDGRVWVESIGAQAASGALPGGRRRLVVVGNGMAAMRTVEELLKLAPDRYEITVFGTEPRGNYNRILLSPLLAGEIAATELELHGREWYEQNGITLHSGDTVTAIDRVRRRVMSSGGVMAPYDRLLLATGSDPVRLKVKGQELPGVFYFRSLDDVEGMLQQAKTAQRAAVIGGGLLGLEAASALAKQGLQVTVIHRGSRLMDKQLDDDSATLLQRALADRGIEIRLRATTEQFVGSAAIESLLLEGGERIECDMVVIAAGITPRTQLARASGLRCDRGVLVDDTLQTFDPAIYAVGECVQHRGETFGLVAPLWEQAKVCAAHLAEVGVSRFRGAQPSSQLKVSGIEVFSAGDITGLMSAAPLRLSDPSAGVYKRLWVDGGKLRAAVMFGDTSQASGYAQLIQTQRDVSEFRHELLLGSAQSFDP